MLPGSALVWARAQLEGEATGDRSCQFLAVLGGIYVVLFGLAILLLLE